ncbi:MAG: SAF domain-containing protein [Acidimicrobiales bacterium]
MVVNSAAETASSGSASPPPAGGRPFAGRSALPSSRAVVGALLVSVAAVTAFATVRSARTGPTGTVVVATADVPAGQRLTEADVDERPVDLPAELAGRTYAQTGDVVGSVSVTPLAAGDPVLRTTVLAEDEAPPGARVFSFSVDRDRALDGALVPGEHLDVIATYGSGEAALTQVVARTVPLVRAGEVGRGALGAAGKVTVTVALPTDDEVVRVAHASQVAAVTLVRATGTSAAASPSPEARTPGPARSEVAASASSGAGERSTTTTTRTGG